MRSFIGIGVLFLLVSVLVAAQEKGSAETGAFNTNLVKANKRLSDAVMRVNKALQPVFKTKPADADIDEVRLAHRNLEATLKIVAADIEGWKLPAGDDVKELVASQRRFLKVQQDSLKPIAEIIEILQDADLSIGGKSKRIKVVLDKFEPGELKALDDLQRRHAAFAKEHMVGLMDPFVPIQGSKESLAFNESLVAANRQLAKASTLFGKSLIAFAQQQDGNVEEVQRTFKAMEEVLAKVKADMKTQKIPYGKSAKEFYDGHQRFLKNQDVAMQELAKITKVVADPNLTKKEKVDLIIAGALRVDQSEKVALRDLQAVQVIYAREHGITLVPVKNP